MRSGQLLTNGTPRFTTPHPPSPPPGPAETSVRPCPTASLLWLPAATSTAPHEVSVSLSPSEQSPALSAAIAAQHTCRGAHKNDSLGLARWAAYRTPTGLDTCMSRLICESRMIKQKCPTWPSGPVALQDTCRRAGTSEIAAGASALRTREAMSEAHGLAETWHDPPLPSEVRPTGTNKRVACHKLTC